ncbi:DUF4157 domain-containing protein [Plasticicumulans acidivorans]|uniref:Uncharacterized protein DUF4157 n=1 Tax=Plasticicumulans acidivorans TaxID=886464 RepID=A0A317MUX4_9GAMM|nr:DUF4157 domain-containing protein [Plasticicumulans acidivorans]PWV61187.1 uncharacterized protein DUF4157 [Plasticicumulans acidivorans]
MSLARRHRSTSPRPRAAQAAAPQAAAARTRPATARCACGGGCPRCQAALSTPGDASERAAERHAALALSGALPPPAVLTPGIDTALAAAVPSGGEALAPALRQDLQARFGTDLGAIRVHRDAAAAQAAAGFAARAYALGPHLVFGAGRYAPHSAAGRRLLAHELAHALQPGAGRRIARDCDAALAARVLPAGDSRLRARAHLDLGRVPVAAALSADLGGDFDLLIHLPRALQQDLAGGAAAGGLAGLLGGMQVSADISAQIGTPLAPGGGGGALCLFVSFHEDTPGSHAWFADLTVLGGGHLNVPLQLNTGTPTTAPATGTLGSVGPLGIGRPSGALRIDLALAEDLSASLGPLQLPGGGGVSAVWTALRAQLRDFLALRVRGIALNELTRIRGALSLPLTLGTPAPGAEPTTIPLDVLGNIPLSVSLRQDTGRFSLSLRPELTASAFGGLLSLDLSGHGQLSAPLPSSLRFADLQGDFFRQLLAQGEGSAGLRGRLTLAGLPGGRLQADFTLRDGVLSGEGTALTPVGVGGGRLRYSLGGGLRAEAGALGLTRLIIAPVDERPEAARWFGPYREYGFGETLYGLGASGALLRPGLAQTLSVGVAPQFIDEPKGSHADIAGSVRLPLTDTPVGIYAGFTYTLQTDFGWLAGRR